MEPRETVPSNPSEDTQIVAESPSGHSVGEEAPRAFPRIVAVIPALDEALSIARVVEALLGQRTVALHRVLVVDNGSTDGTGELARRAGASVVREERRGYGYACLAGVLAAEEAAVIVLFDSRGSAPGWFYRRNAEGPGRERVALYRVGYLASRVPYVKFTSARHSRSSRRRCSSSSGGRSPARFRPSVGSLDRSNNSSGLSSKW